jgi:hypothetical protein
MALELVTGLGTAILAVAIIWALIRVSRRAPADDTREHYRRIHTADKFPVWLPKRR